MITKAAKSILAVATALILAACVASVGPISDADTQVLFIGNSHTYNNDVPGMFEELARASGLSVDAETVAHGGWTLLDHAQSQETIDRIRNAQWDYVVLQEQSDIPSFEFNREHEMYPSIRSLHREIQAVGADTVLFMTWGHQDGSIAQGIGGYGEESALLENAYVQIGQELDVKIAPVGVAWWLAMQSAPNVVMWTDDGNHATKEGSYLAASVLYHVILGQSPEINSYTAGLSEDWALFFRRIAAEAVFANPARWNFP